MTRAGSRFLNEGQVIETPSGSINGGNSTFTLAFVPDDGTSVALYLDGLLETAYSITGQTITMTTPPSVGQTLKAIYNKRI